ncbi:MAG: PorP/SprF family type IX secretion system membrane protein [Saprospiraceae bacterium]
MNGDIRLGLAARVLVTILSFTSLLQSQDFHFSQYYSSPLQLNPALTGLINGSFRFNINYRDQWNKLEGNNFKTTAVSGDMNFRTPIKAFQKDLIGIGVSILADRNAGFDLNNTELALNTAYHKSTGKNQFLSLGLKLGIAQRNLNYENLRFEDQYVEGSGYSKNTQEFLPENNFSNLELALGLHYTWTGNDEQGFTIGMALHHITSPDYSFFNLSLPVGVDPIKHPLYGIKSIHASGSLKISEGAVILPRVWILSQGPHFQVNVGSLIKLPLDRDHYKNFNIGGFLRSTKNINGFAPESFIPMIGLELGNFNVGLSYDANLKRIASSYLNQSIFELSISLIGNHDNEGFFCPRF